MGSYLNYNLIFFLERSLFWFWNPKWKNAKYWNFFTYQKTGIKPSWSNFFRKIPNSYSSVSCISFNKWRHNVNMCFYCADSLILGIEAKQLTKFFKHVATHSIFKKSYPSIFEILLSFYFKKERRECAVVQIFMGNPNIQQDIMMLVGTALYKWNSFYFVPKIHIDLRFCDFAFKLVSTTQCTRNSPCRLSVLTLSFNGRNKSTSHSWCFM